MTKEEIISVVDMFEDLVERIIERDKQNDDEFGDGGFSNRNVKICKEELVSDIMRIFTEVAER